MMKWTRSRGAWLPLVALAFPASAEYDRRTAVVQAVAKTQEAVVNLRTLRVIPSRFEDGEGGGRIRGLGTGVVIDPRGYIITNHHVVEKMDQIRCLTHHGKEFPARVINFDDKADLAVLKVDSPERLAYLPLTGCGKPIVGETVIAIGNPWGLEHTVTTGIVSYVDRELRLPNDEIFDDLIQTDARINPGNSGGPLLSINGDLLGVNVAIRSNAQGIGFAIPTHKVRRVVEDLLGAPPISIARQGLELREAPEISLTSKERQGVKVAKVEPGSPADRTGFREGDELISVAGEDVRIRFDLNRILWDRRFGESVPFTIRRNGRETKTLLFTMTPTADMSDEELLWQKLGIRARPVSMERVRGINPQWNGGLLLLQVASESIAGRAGFRVGDILIGIQGWETTSPNNVRWVMQWKELAQHQPVEYMLVRDGALLPVGRMNFPQFP